MKNAVSLSLLWIIFAAQAWAAASGPAVHSGLAGRESGAASAHAAGSTVHALAASGQVTSAVSSVPLAVSGVTLIAAGAASSAAAAGLHRAAMAPAGTPLPITDESLVTVPPDQALQHP